MQEKQVIRTEQAQPPDHERLQIRELVALTPAERVRLMVESARNWIAAMEKMRVK